MGKASNSPECRDKVPQIRSSGRIIKRPRRDLTPPPSPPKKAKEKTPESKPAVRRPWEQWTATEIKVFFEAVYEHGRDFDSIHQHFIHKYKKTPEIHKSKEQIRFFYYRTCKKASKYIRLSEEVNKQVLEVYSLINYGEFRKKGITKLDEKIGSKLNELVHKGTTVIKIKGKNYRLKTPACKALLKLHQIEDNNKEPDDQHQVTLPSHITVQLYPRNSEAWTDVQMLSQNPRLRVKARPGRRLSSIFDFLESKWKSERQRNKEKLESKSERSSKELRLYAQDESPFSYYEIKAPPPQPKRMLSMDYYLEHIKSLVNSCTNTSSPSSQRGGKRKARSQSTAAEETTAASSVATTSSTICSSSAASIGSTSNSVVRELCSSLLYGEEAQHADVAAAFIENNKILKDSPEQVQTEEVKAGLSEVSTEVKDQTEEEHKPDANEKDLDKTDDKDVMIVSVVNGRCKSNSDIKQNNNPIENTDVDNNIIHNDLLDIKTEEGIEPETKDPVQLASAFAPNSNQKMQKGDVYIVFGSKQTAKNAKDKKSSKPLISEVQTDKKNKSPWRLKLDEKMNLLKEGISKKDAEQLLIGDLYLLMGNPDKVCLTYEWMEPSPMPDILELGNMNNMMRRLLHVATAEYSDIHKPWSVPAVLQEVNNKVTKTANKEVQVTMVAAKEGSSPRGGSPALLGKRINNPTTPKGSIRIKNDPSTPTTPKSSHIKPDLLSPTSSIPPPLKIIPIPNQSAVITNTTVVPNVTPINIAPAPTLPSTVNKDNVFKMPSSVPVTRTVQSIAPRQLKPGEKVEPLRLMEGFPRRRRCARQRKLVVRRNIAAKEPESIMHLTILPPSNTAQVNAAQLSTAKLSTSQLNVAQFNTAQLSTPVTSPTIYIPQTQLAPLTTSTLTNTQALLLQTAQTGQALTGMVGTSSQDISLKNVIVQPPGGINATTTGGAQTLVTLRATTTTTNTTNSTIPTITLPPSTAMHIQKLQQQQSLQQVKKPAPTVMVLDPTHFAMKAKCRRIIPTPVGAVTGDKELSQNMQTVIEDSAQDTSSLQNVPVLVPTTVTTVPVCSIPESTAVTSSSSITVNSISSSTSVTTSSLDSSNIISIQSLSAPASEQQLMSITQPIALSQDSSSMSGFTRLLNGLDTSVLSEPASTATSSIPKSPISTTAPTLTSTMLDISLPGPPDVDQSTDKLIDLALENSTQSFSAISGLLDQSMQEASKTTDKESIPTQVFINSPTKISKPIVPLGPEQQWLNGEDFNLSSFLDNSKDGSGSVKKVANPGLAFQGNGQTFGILGENSRDSLASKFDVDTTLHCMMNESSIDYMSKFADLVQEVTATSTEETPQQTTE